MPSARFGKFLALALSMATLQTSGCGGGGDALPREAFSGTVTLDGQPMPAGTIVFMPSGGDQSTSGSAPIQDGAFSVSSEKGLLPGNYDVRIYGAAKAAKAVDELPGEPGPPPKELVPPKYNVKTTLKAEVKKGQANTFPFELSSR